MRVSIWCLLLVGAALTTCACAQPTTAPAKPPVDGPVTPAEAKELVREAVTRVGNAQTLAIQTREREHTRPTGDDSQVRFGLSATEGDAVLYRLGDEQLSQRGGLFGGRGASDDRRRIVITEGTVYTRTSPTGPTEAQQIVGTVDDCIRERLTQIGLGEPLSLLVQHGSWERFFRYCDDFRDLGPARVTHAGTFLRIGFNDWRGRSWEMWIGRWDPPEIYRVITVSPRSVGVGRGENPLSPDGRFDRSKFVTVAAVATYELTLTRWDVDQELPADAFALPPEPFEPPAHPLGARRSVDGGHVGDLRFKDLDGAEITVDGTTGRPVVIVSWQEKWPEMLVAARTAGRVLGERGDDVLILAVNGADTAQRARELARDMPANVRVALDPDQAMQSLMNARMVVIAADGTVVWTSHGGQPHAFDELRTAVEAGR
mgnify:CR=1 FL=1